ncbi:lysis protein [Enterobacter sp. ASE]|uniref:lysis protein n=1 Tax=Enterobacter sp. ASE TaxID=2905968 RepID=UPI001E381B2A|nr:lysis protein [Enterobacter sp. ASE]MCE3116174.1 lysis protein [Enterobacter sp. ASE]
MSRWVTFGLMLAVVALGWTADHYYGKALDWRDKYRTAYSTTQQQADMIDDMQARQQSLAELDKKHTEALSAAKTENNNLRRQLADGSRRMYVRAKCPVSATAKAAGAGSMGHDALVELSSGAGQNVLDIRAGIISDQRKLKYLQDYIRQQCMK